MQPVSSLTAKIQFQTPPPPHPPQTPARRSTCRHAATHVRGSAGGAPIPPRTGRGIQNELFLELKTGACVLSWVSCWQPGCLFLSPSLHCARSALFIFLRLPSLAMHVNFVEAASSALGSEREGGGVLHPDLLPQSTGALLIAPRLSCFHCDGGKWAELRV